MKLLKKGFITSIITACVLTVGTSMYSTTEAFASVTQRTITVTGGSSVTFQPNIATIDVGVITTNEDIHTAQLENNAKVEELIQKLKEFGIHIDDITTSFYNVSPNHHFNFNQLESYEYRVENNLSINIRNLDDIGDIMMLSVENGANTLGGVTFSNTNIEVYYLKALEQAILNASQKANVIANTIGYELAGIISVVEENLFNNMPISRSNVFLASENITSSVPIVSPSELSLSANVTLVFEY